MRDDVCHYLGGVDVRTLTRLLFACLEEQKNQLPS